MSRFDYHSSLEISELEVPFNAIIMAAMRRADSSNISKLKNAFPEVWKELEDRYNAPGGVLPGEKFT